MFVLDAVPQAVPQRAERDPITVIRWRRFHRDRAYVQLHGDHIGFRDLATGEVRAFRSEDVDLIARVTADLQREADTRRAG
jgi:hypothetical protein